MSKRHRSILLTGVVVGACMLLFGVYSVVNNRASESDRERTFDSLALTLENGEPLDISDFGDTPTVVIAWATWCPSCIEALAVAATVRTHSQTPFRVVAVNRSEELSIINDYRTAFGLPQNITYVSDRADAYFSRIDGRSMPEVVVYDARGVVVAHLLATPTTEELSALITSAHSR
jgi:thiol-disulfide isomerase/thioredoxin